MTYSYIEHELPLSQLMLGEGHYLVLTARIYVAFTWQSTRYRHDNRHDWSTKTSPVKETVECKTLVFQRFQNSLQPTGTSRFAVGYIVMLQDLFLLCFPG